MSSDHGRAGRCAGRHGAGDLSRQNSNHSRRSGRSRFPDRSAAATSSAVRKPVGRPWHEITAVGHAPGMGNSRLVVCDLGGVLIQYSWERATAAWAAAASVDAVLGEAASYDSVWNAFEVDAIDERCFFEHLRRRYGHDIDHESLVAGWNDIYIGVNAEWLPCWSNSETRNSASWRQRTPTCHTSASGADDSPRTSRCSRRSIHRAR